jgi:hypothetical protein
VTLRWDFSATQAKLDALLETERSRKAADFAAFQQHIAQGWSPSQPEGEWPEPDGTREPARRGRRVTAPAPPDEPYVRLPERTTHGGGFGPRVRQHLIDEALSGRRW